MIVGLLLLTDILSSVVDLENQCLLFAMGMVEQFMVLTVETNVGLFDTAAHNMHSDIFAFNLRFRINKISFFSKQCCRFCK